MLLWCREARWSSTLGFCGCWSLRDEIAAILGHEAAHVVSRHIVSTPHTNASRLCIGYYTSELHARLLICQ